MPPKPTGEGTGDYVTFLVEYEDGTTAEFSIDRWTLSSGDHVAPIIAREQQGEGNLPLGAIKTVRRIEIEWLAPMKLRESCVDHAFSTIQEAERALYQAVISGEVRSRRKGIVFGPEMLKQIDRLVFHDIDPCALPPDIELSVGDAKRKWPR
jgi:hypothetical protein